MDLAQKTAFQDYLKSQIFDRPWAPMVKSTKGHLKSKKMRQIPIIAQNPKKAAKSRYFAKPHGKGPDKEIYLVLKAF